MALLNVRSLLNKTFIINYLILDNLLCLFLTETWLSADAPAVLTEASPPNFNFSYSTRSSQRGGGTALISSSTLSAKPVLFDNFTTFEYTASVFNTPQILCVTVYRPPKRNALFISEFSEFLSILHNSYDMIILAGDFNLHIDNLLDPLSTDFLNILNVMDFTQNIMHLTHNRGHTLDLVITYGLSTSVSSVVDLAVSDHYCVFFEITSFIQLETSVRTVRKRHLTPEVAAGFPEIFKKFPPIPLPAPCDFIVNDFNSRLQSALDLLAPLKIIKINSKRNVPWRNEDIKKLKRSCRAAERQWRKNKTNHQIYIENLKLYNTALRNSRNAYFSRIISENKNNPKILFSTIDNILNHNSNIFQKTPSNTLCEEFADHFRGKVDTIRHNILSS